MHDYQLHHLHPRGSSSEAKTTTTMTTTTTTSYKTAGDRRWVEIIWVKFGFRYLSIIHSFQININLCYSPKHIKKQQNKTKQKNLTTYFTIQK